MITEIKYNNCCYMEIRQCHHNPWAHLGNTYERIYRAGTIILDYTLKKILIVQTYGTVWGPPKGRVNPGESFKDCAIRETHEETGILLSETELKKYKKLFDDRTYLYILKGDKFRHSIHIKDIHENEISGIGWLCINCLKKLREEKKTNSYINQLFNFFLKEINK